MAPAVAALQFARVILEIEVVHDEMGMLLYERLELIWAKVRVYGQSNGRPCFFFFLSPCLLFLWPI